MPPHRTTARLIVLDGAQSLLLVRYAEHRSGRPGSYWATPGGAIEPGETPHEAAARELREETGLRVPVGRSLWTRTVTFELPQGWVEQEEIFFLVQLTEIAPPVRNSSAEAILEHRWWRRAALERTGEAVYPEGLADWFVVLDETGPDRPLQLGSCQSSGRGMKAEILAQPPLSGVYREAHFDSVGTCTWILFRPFDGEDWVCVFGRGINDHNAVVFHPCGEAFVVAGGRGYVIDTQSRTLLHKTDRSHFVDVVADLEPGAFVVADDLRLYGYGNDGRRWLTPRISWDGIRNLVLEGHLVKGEAWGLDDKWYGFTLDPSSGQVTNATYRGPDAIPG